MNTDATGETSDRVTVACQKMVSINELSSEKLLPAKASDGETVDGVREKSRDLLAKYLGKEMDQKARRIAESVSSLSFHHYIFNTMSLIFLRFEK